MNTETILILGFMLVAVMILSWNRQPTIIKVEKPAPEPAPESVIPPILAPNDSFYNTIYDNTFWNEYWPLNDPYYARRIDYVYDRHHYDDYFGHPRYYESPRGYGHSKYYHSATPSHRSTGHKYSGHSYRQQRPSARSHAYRHVNRSMTGGVSRSPSMTGGHRGVPSRPKHSFEKFTQEDEE